MLLREPSLCRISVEEMWLDTVVSMYTLDFRKTIVF
jgi:hypothetical protein